MSAGITSGASPLSPGLESAHCPSPSSPYLYLDYIKSESTSANSPSEHEHYYLDTPVDDESRSRPLITPLVSPADSIMSFPAGFGSGSSGGGGSSGGSSSGGAGSRRKGAQSSVRQLVETLEMHRVNTLTELCRIERIAAATEDEEDARAFQGPMTAAWTYYVTTNLLTELRGLTRSYPFSADLLREARSRVVNDPNSNRSWNMAWLCLRKMLDDDLVGFFSRAEAILPIMWGGRDPTAEEADKLTACFEYEWKAAIEMLLRHWPAAPTWY